MARIRTIKPDFFLHEEMAGCDPHARLLAIALLNHADCEGRMRWLVAMLHGAIFPYEPEISVPELAAQLEDIGYLTLYDHDGKQYCQITHFTKHQRISGKERSVPSRCPPIPKGWKKARFGEAPGRVPGKHLGESRGSTWARPGDDKKTHAGKHPSASPFSQTSVLGDDDRAQLVLEGCAGGAPERSEIAVDGQNQNGQFDRNHGFLGSNREAPECFPDYQKNDEKTPLRNLTGNRKLEVGIGKDTGGAQTVDQRGVDVMDHDVGLHGHGGARTPPSRLAIAPVEQEVARSWFIEQGAESLFSQWWARMETDQWINRRGTAISWMESARACIAARKAMVKPTLEEVREFVATNGLLVEAEAFFHFYESKGWLVGKQPMQKWRSAVQNWHHKEKNNRKTTSADVIAAPVELPKRRN